MLNHELGCSQYALKFPCNCSASNYLLGMTPLELPAFMTGTVAGMSVWGLVYASLGGASRSLLKSGMDLEELIGGETPLAQDPLLQALPTVPGSMHEI